jgi:hypothetical protein
LECVFVCCQLYLRPEMKKFPNKMWIIEQLGDTPKQMMEDLRILSFCGGKTGSLVWTMN